MPEYSPALERLADRFGWQIVLQSEPGHGTLAMLKFA